MKTDSVKAVLRVSFIMLVAIGFGMSILSVKKLLSPTSGSETDSAPVSVQENTDMRFVGVDGTVYQISVTPEMVVVDSPSHSAHMPTVAENPAFPPLRTVDDLLDAIRQVESGGEPNGGRDAIGDGGNALGPFQIWRPYWQDAVEHDLRHGGKFNIANGSYEDVRDNGYARRVVKAYWDRYAPANASFEDLARIHCGGPQGHNKSTTKTYWQKVERILWG